MIQVKVLQITWDAVDGATGYSILVDGRQVSTVGRKAGVLKPRTWAHIALLPDDHTISIEDLPDRRVTQSFDTSYT
jgi:hypothetical protein